MSSHRTLIGHTLRLEPLDTSHREALLSAAADPRIWPYIPQASADFDFATWLCSAYEEHAAGRALVYVVIDGMSDRVIGSSRFYDFVPAHRRLQIGSTWYHPSMWGTNINPACKLLMLDDAFNVQRCHRVGFSVDQRNERSLAALRRLGATEEGVLYRHMLARNDVVRNTVSFSITDLTWPAVREKLLQRMETKSTR